MQEDDYYSGMTIKRICLFSFVITLAVWTWFSWPLPRYFGAGIPAAAHIGPAEVQPLIPGDHLQFMYYCWLAGDMATGKTPLFCNPYEFNTGGEKSGYRPDAYYFPFSLIYSFFALAGQSAGAAAGGRALAWNLTGFLSLWMTYFLTWLLVRRYAKPDWLAGCAAIIAIALPFRWINLFGGSPAGFACMWIPAILLGIDLAVREGKAVGGFLAGISILFAAWTDQHIFFFGSLAVPVWTLIALAAEVDSSTVISNGRAGQLAAAAQAVRPYLLERESWQKIFIALLPVPLFLGLALAFPMIIQQITGAAADQHLGSSVAARTFREIALYSPHAEDFFAWFSSGIVSQHIYIGISIFVFLIAGTTCMIVAAFRRRNDTWPRLAVIILLLAAMAGIMALAIGTNGPFHAILFRICRKVIPPYAMIRQPAKIFCLMPSFLAVAAGISLGAILINLKTRWIKIFMALIFCAAVTGEYVLRVRPTVSMLDSKQGAYEAVAHDAASSGKSPHALIVPLWPGDSADSSIYQYYVSLYRIRMVNGYNPFVSKSYFKDVFLRYESVNQGRLTDDQIDELLRRKIEYIILHEDLFPEKVSPFPVGWTLKQFLANKRLRLVKQDGRVWAFKMLAEPGQMEKSGADNWETFACARNWQAENLAAGKTKIIRDVLKIRGAHAVLNEPGSWLATPAGRPVAPAPQLLWMIRLRGEGSILAENFADGKRIAGDLFDISEDEWTWVSVPVPNTGVFVPRSLKLAWEDGAVDCDQILLVNGDWTPPAVGQTINLPAPCMFHAGYTSLGNNAVVFETKRDRTGWVLYGPKLPLEKGRYRIELVFNSDSPHGVLLGQFNVKRHESDCILNCIPVVAGTRSLADFAQIQNVPMSLEFLFLGSGGLKISGIRLTRLE